MATVTALDITTAALRKIGVVDHEEAATASQGALGVARLNRMLTRWEANGVSLGFVELSIPADTLRIPEEAQEAVENSLAVALCPSFERSATQELVSAADEGYRALLRDCFQVVPLDGRSMPSARGSYDINSDT